MNKKDFLLAGIAGFFTALFLLPVIKNAEILGAQYISYFLIIGLPILWMIALIVGNFLSRWVSWINQLARFSVIGFLNAAIDFGVLNLLSLYTGLTSGIIIGGVNVPGFIVAATNSYFWNKFWVFKKNEENGKRNYKDIFSFALVTVSGAVLNSIIVVFMSTYIHPLFGLSPERWLNISKIIASMILLLWNFIGYRLFVFKAKEIQQQIPQSTQAM